MIRFLFIHLFYAKKRNIICIGLCGLIALMIFLILPDASISEQILYQGYYQMYHTQMVKKWLSLFMPFFAILCVMDHDQSFIKPLISYFGRTQVIYAKLGLYSLVLFWFYLICFLIYHLSFYLLTSYYSFDFSSLSFFIGIYLDALILMNVILYSIREKLRSVALLIGLFYMIFSIVLEDSASLTLFYVFPIHYATIDRTTLAYLYKLCYICLGLSLVIQKMRYEKII